MILCVLLWMTGTFGVERDGGGVDQGVQRAVSAELLLCKMGCKEVCSLLIYAYLHLIDLLGMWCSPASE